MVLPGPAAGFKVSPENFSKAISIISFPYNFFLAGSYLRLDLSQSKNTELIGMKTKDKNYGLNT